MSTSTITHSISQTAKKKGHRELRIGLFGFGVVGSGVVKILQQKREEFQRLFKTDVYVDRICVRDTEKKREALYPHDRLTTNPTDLIEDESLDCITDRHDWSAADFCRQSHGSECDVGALVQARPNRLSSSRCAIACPFHECDESRHHFAAAKRASHEL